VTTEPVETDAASPPDAEDDRESITELLEQFSRDSSAVVLREMELTAARHDSELRRGGRDASSLALAGVAIGTAFLLANWAAVRGLSGSLSSWRAPLVLAAVWLVVGAALAAKPMARLRRLVGRSAEPIPIADREQARDDAVQTARESLERLAEGVADEVESRMVSAVVPTAGGMVEAGEALIEASDELLEDVVDQMPGGSVVGQVIDFALIPGRFGIRIVTTVLRGGGPGSSTE
jgi:putative superfamily III holin-X